MNSIEYIVLIIAMIFLLLSVIKSNELLLIPFVFLWFGWLGYRLFGYNDAVSIVLSLLSLIILLLGIRFLIYHKHNIYIGILLTLIGLISSYYTLSVLLW